MAKLNLDNAMISDMENRVENWEITPKNTDGITQQDETEWINSKWSTYWGAFNEIADLKAALTMKTIWNVGKGYTADPETKVILDHISGWGKDSFDDILFNLDLISRIGGDAFAEIIRDEDSGILINLKPLDPGSIKIIVDRKGIIKRYEQIDKTANKKVIERFEPEEILHISNLRIADQIHGISEIEALESRIKANEENFEDLKKIMHRQARPMIMFKLGTDDDAKISAFVEKMDRATNKGENVYIPDDDNAVSYEVVQVNVSNLVLQWRDELRNSFFRAIGLPQIVPGASGQSTESESKVIYLAFEQLVEQSQRKLEQQIWNQLQLRINLYPPATLSAELQNDNSKDGAMLPQPSDTIAGRGR